MIEVDLVTNQVVHLVAAPGRLYTPLSVASLNRHNNISSAAQIRQDEALSGDD